MGHRSTGVRHSPTAVSTTRHAAARELGFTLLELVIVLSIGLILLAFAVPMVQSALRNYTLSSAASNITRITQLARMTAVRQGGNACTVLDGNLFGLDPDCDGTLTTTDMAYAVPAGVSLADDGPAPNGMNFSTDPTVVDSTSDFAITFNSRGNTTLAPAASLIYLEGWENFAAVTVSGAGRPRTWRYNGETWY